MVLCSFKMQPSASIIHETSRVLFAVDRRPGGIRGKSPHLLLFRLGFGISDNSFFFRCRFKFQPPAAFHRAKGMLCRRFFSFSGRAILNGNVTSAAQGPIFQ